MTHEQFLKYILSSGCHIHSIRSKYYVLRKDGSTGTQNMSGLFITDPNEILNEEYISQVSKALGIEEPK